MSSNDILKNINCDEEFKLTDYTVQEMENIIIKSNKKSQNITQKKKTNKNYETFKDKYFSYYDDIKSHTLKKQDW